MKSDARRQAREHRKTLGSAFNPHSLVTHFPMIKTADIIAGFAPIGDEIDVWPLLNHLYEIGHEVCLPVTPEAAGPLKFHRWIPGIEMKKDRFGVSFPTQADEMIPNFVLVPLLAFTSHGTRLGYGGGFYDRTLESLRAKGEIFACGVAYAGQEIADLPVGKHDQPLDGILTESVFRKF